MGWPYLYPTKAFGDYQRINYADGVYLRVVIARVVATGHIFGSYMTS